MLLKQYKLTIEEENRTAKALFAAARRAGFENWKLHDAMAAIDFITKAKDINDVIQALGCKDYDDNVDSTILMDPYNIIMPVSIDNLTFSQVYARPLWIVESPLV